jgi:hypothetical protein
MEEKARRDFQQTIVTRDSLNRGFQFHALLDLHPVFAIECLHAGFMCVHTDTPVNSELVYPHFLAAVVRLPDGHYGASLTLIY